MCCKERSLKLPTVVTVYSKPDCVQCTATKRYLMTNHIPFEEKDALEEGNNEAIKYLGYMSAPVVVVAKNGPGSEEHWYGFNKAKLESIKEPSAA